MNVFRDTDDSTADDRKMRRSLAASIARHEAAVETLKWHMEMDDYDDYDDSVGRRRALYSEDQRDYWSDDAAPRTAARYPTDSRWDSDRHFRADERIEDPRLVGVGSVGRKFSPYWSDDNGFRVDAKLTSTRAARLPTALELDDERNAGVRAYLERKLRDYQPLQPPAIHSARTVQLPSPPRLRGYQHRIAPATVAAGMRAAQDSSATNSSRQTLSSGKLSVQCRRLMNWWRPATNSAGGPLDRLASKRHWTGRPTGRMLVGHFSSEGRIRQALGTTDTLGQW
ncbi:hypothetical protein BOX15_Mlig008912g3 [Macrostomum lignano]|uniref:Uncharacterized protein n=1 Tax=Macrostomum lignano TaxID=282301 RepID=A0A267DDX2_9PLAT|nr:hypothetical protein BOX15_Mlig008912g3 [Macrostomum lignano]